MKTIIIPANALRAACLFAEVLNPEKFPNSGCVHVEATGTQVRLSATNGHVGLLQQYHVQNIGVVRETVLIPVLDMVDFIKAAPLDAPFKLLLLAQRGSAELVADGKSASFRNVDGAYPDLVKAIPETLSDKPAQFDPEYTARFAKAAKFLHTDVDEGKKPAMTIAYNGPKGNSIARFGANLTAIGIIAAVAPETSGVIIPVWVKQDMHVSGEVKQAEPESVDDLLGGPPEVKQEPAAPAKTRKPRAKKTEEVKPVAAPEPDDCSDLV